jgi:hypothetical protein
MLFMAVSAIEVVSRIELMGIPRYLKLVTTSMVAAWREGEAGKGNVWQRELGDCLAGI